MYIIQQILQYIYMCLFTQTWKKHWSSSYLRQKFLLYRKTKEMHLSPRINQLRCQQEISSLPGISKFMNAEWSLNLEYSFFPQQGYNKWTILPPKALSTLNKHYKITPFIYGHAVSDALQIRLSPLLWRLEFFSSLFTLSLLIPGQFGNSENKQAI